MRVISPRLIQTLDSNQVFVFGSNTEGRHGKGAAKEAFGRNTHRPGVVGRWAIYGTAYGFMQGKEGASYAIITKELRPSFPKITLEQVRIQVDQFLIWAKKNPNKEMLVTMLGCNLAGFQVNQIASLFGKEIPPNVALPEQFWDYLDSH